MKYGGIKWHGDKKMSVATEILCARACCVGQVALLAELIQWISMQMGRLFTITISLEGTFGLTFVALVNSLSSEGR